MTEIELKPSCVNCNYQRNCVLAKSLRDFKNHIHEVGLHCGDWEPEISFHDPETI
jgi:hypothetical protein